MVNVKHKRKQHEWYKNNREHVKEKSRKWAKNNKERTLENARNWARNNPEKRKLISIRHKLKKIYKITLDQYLDLEQLQAGLCAICQQPEANTTAKTKLGSLAVDHNHKTGKVRGLLCKGCNMALGNMKESPERLRAAAIYLETHNERA